MSQDKYKVRAELIAGNYHRVVAKFEKIETDNILNGVIQDPVQDDIYFDLLNTIGQSGIKECHRINRNTDNRTYRVRKRVKKLIESGPCLFLTFTFTDKSLNETNEKTRRKAVISCLNSFDNRGYVGNIDFGVDDDYTHREHYHCLVGVDFVDNTGNKLWKYGDLDIKKVRINEDEKDKSVKKIPKYISKLTNHAVKDSARQCRLIFSRKK